MFDTDKVIVVADVTKQPYLRLCSPARYFGTRRLVKGIFGYGLRQIYSRR